MAIPRERLLPQLESMLLMRRVEEACCNLGPKEVFGNYHVYIGQEATGASVMAQLGAEDAMFSTHRNHGHNLAKGVGPEQLFAEAPSGSQMASWIEPGHVYVFILRDMNGNEIARDRLDLRSRTRYRR